MNRETAEVDVQDLSMLFLLSWREDQGTLEKRGREGAGEQEEGEQLASLLPTRIAFLLSFPVAFLLSFLSLFW